MRSRVGATSGYLLLAPLVARGWAWPIGTVAAGLVALALTLFCLDGVVVARDASGSPAAAAHPPPAPAAPGGLWGAALRHFGATPRAARAPRRRTATVTRGRRRVRGGASTVLTTPRVPSVVRASDWRRATAV